MVVVEEEEERCVRRSRLLLSIHDKMRKEEEDEHAEVERDVRKRSSGMDDSALRMLTNLTNVERVGKEGERRRRERERANVPSLGQLAGAQFREEEEKQPMCYRAQRDGTFDHYGLAVALKDDGGGGAGIGWEARGSTRLGKDVLE